jgi:hypothetical protein
MSKQECRIHAPQMASAQQGVLCYVRLSLWHMTPQEFVPKIHAMVPFMVMKYTAMGEECQTTFGGREDNATVLLPSYELPRSRTGSERLCPVDLSRRIRDRCNRSPQHSVIGLSALKTPCKDGQRRLTALRDIKLLLDPLYIVLHLPLNPRGG